MGYLLQGTGSIYPARPVESVGAQLNRLEMRISFLEEHVKELQNALQMYGKHSEDCHKLFTGVCDCGFEKELGLK